MKMKRILCVLLSAMMLLSVLTACGSTSNDEESSGTTTPTADQIIDSADIEACEIVFWHAMSNKQEEALTAITDEFNATNERGITVTLVNQGAYTDLSTKLTASAASDTLPDLSQAYNNYVTSYLDKLVHLDAYVERDYDEMDYEDILESYRDENSEFGFVSGMPFNKSTYLYFYNKTLFDQLGLSAPETWDDLITIGQTFQSELGMVSLGYDDLAGLIEATLLQNGAEYISEDGAEFDTEEGLEAITYLMGLYNNGYARLVGEDLYFSGPLGNCLVGAYVGSSTGVSYITMNEGYELGVSTLPGNTTKAANTAGTNVMMFTTDLNKQAAAWEYLKFLTNTENTVYWAMATGYMPIRTSGFESDEYQEYMASSEAAQACYAQQDAYFSSLNFDGSYDVRNDIGSKFEELVLAGADGQTALDELAALVNGILQ